mmetsp:Transcript_20409/g.18547  ORF Transcript_20409/g.18547 Transcript_20409/m.18547 type:complete len:356 (+) Transcript_20409:39-1106(+)
MSYQEQNAILVAVQSGHASDNTKFHCLYGYYFIGISPANLAIIYKKSRSVIYNWIQRWETYKIVNRLNLGINTRKFNLEKQEFIIQLYQQNPTLFLDEVRTKFIRNFQMNISMSTVWRIITNAGLTRKVIERRAIQISIQEIIRFTKELASLPFHWTYQNLIFLDEVGFDNRDMFRKRGYAIKGKRIIFRGEFTRSERCSLLCFLGVDGLQQVYSTEGTFDRLKFISYCRDFALSGKVQLYPGINSVWIMDGASIHCDESITYYLRSLGIYTIYLPAYCPFYNPIEIVFGNVKSYLRRHYFENSSLKEIKIFISQAMNSFKNKSMRKIFKKCGYYGSGFFNPGIGFSQNISNFGF